MTAEVGKKCIAMPDYAERRYVYIDGHVPEVGEQVMAYPLPGGGYVVIPLPVVEIGDMLPLMPFQESYIPFGIYDNVLRWSWDEWTFDYGMCYPNGGVTLDYGVYAEGAVTSPPVANPDTYVGYLGASVWTSHFYDPSPGIWAEAEKTISGEFSDLSLWVYLLSTSMSGVKFQLYIDGIEKGTVYPTGWKNIQVSQNMTNPIIKIRVEDTDLCGGTQYVRVSNLKLS